MIPQLNPASGYLPPGVHHADWCEVAGRFAGNSHRGRLTDGLLAACLNLAGAGCGELLLDGSFVTAKELPGDYDGRGSQRASTRSCSIRSFSTSPVAVRR